MRSGLLRLGPAFTVCLLAWGVAAAVPKYDTAEVVLHSSQVFDGISGTPNPFTTVVLTLSVTAPDGRTFQVDGFFDGDGNGGAVGDVFKARIYVDQEGTWTWASSSATAGLNGQSGQIVCSGLLDGEFGKGPLIIRGPRPRYFAYADGTPVFLLGKMLDFDAPTPRMRGTLIFLSEVISDIERRAHLDYQHTLDVNKMSIYLFNRNDFDGTEPTNPWLGNCSLTCDKTRFDLSRWQMYDSWARQLRDEGIFAEFWFFADQSGVGAISATDRNRLIRYGMARLSGYVNTQFLVSSEWEEAFPAADLSAAAELLQSFNPWRRQASTHCLPGPFDFPDAPWADYMSIQSSILGTWQSNHAVSLANRALARKPSMSQEFAQGFESGLSRIKAWSVFTAAQAGTGTGAYLLWLAKFVREVPFYKMEPADSLILAAGTGGAYCMAERGYHYVVYLPLGGPVTLDLTGVTGTFEAQWFNTRTGIWSSAGTVVGGGTPSWVGPFRRRRHRAVPAATGDGTTPPAGDRSRIPGAVGPGLGRHRGRRVLRRGQGRPRHPARAGRLHALRERMPGEQRHRPSRHRRRAAPARRGVLVSGARRAIDRVSGSFSMSEPRERPGRDAEIAASAAHRP